MKFMTKSTFAVSVAALTLGLAACDGPKEDAMEDAGEQNAEMVADEADTMEDAGMITEGEEAAMTDQAEDKADAMEETGEAMDEGTAPAM